MRRQVLDALQTLVAGDPDVAARALLLPPAVAAEALAANAAVRDSGTVPALRRYRGVVYAGLDVTSLSVEQQRWAGRNTVIFSGLFGAVRGDEPIPGTALRPRPPCPVSAPSARSGAGRCASTCPPWCTGG